MSEEPYWVSIRLMIRAESAEEAKEFAREMLQGKELMTRYFSVDEVEAR